MTPSTTITATGLAKRFGRQRLFRDLAFSLTTGQSLSLTGPNGSGKSTLLAIIAGFIAPDSGTLIRDFQGRRITDAEFLTLAGHAGPDINLYGALTGYENLRFAARDNRTESILALLERFDLARHAHRPVSLYSTGMTQRLKFLCAVINNPPVILLDEPGSNLDAPGQEALFGFLEETRKNAIIIIATNDEKESRFCGTRLSLESAS